MFEDIGTEKKCRPVNGIPFRSGVFLIQTYSGQYLEDRGTYVRAKSILFHDVAKSLEVFDNGLTRKRQEWIFVFSGHGTQLYNTDFTIYSGYGLSPTSNKKILTLKLRGKPILSLNTRPFRESEDTTQVWHMEPAMTERGALMVNIFAKFKNSDEKYYVSMPLDQFHSEFTLDTSDSSPHIVVEKEDLNKRLRQAFRLLECDYSEVYATRGVYRTNERLNFDRIGLITKKPIVDKVREPADTLKKLFDASFGNPLNIPKTGTEIKNGQHAYTAPNVPSVMRLGIFMKNMFGISDARNYFMRRQHAEGNTPVLLSRISEAMAESESIYDYAGRMRIKPRDFYLMIKGWQTYKDRLYEIFCFIKCISHRDKLVEYIEKKVKNNFLQSP